MRGVESHGMLLAADYKDENGKACVEPLTAPWANPGDQIYIEGFESNEPMQEDISADLFFQVAINIKDKSVVVDGKKLCVKGKALATTFTENGEVN